MSRTVKGRWACHRPRCGVCHPWKKWRGWSTREERLLPSVRREMERWT